MLCSPSVGQAMRVRSRLGFWVAPSFPRQSWHHVKAAGPPLGLLQHRGSQWSEWSLLKQLEHLHQWFQNSTLNPDLKQEHGLRGSFLRAGGQPPPSRTNDLSDKVFESKCHQKAQYGYGWRKRQEAKSHTSLTYQIWEITGFIQSSAAGKESTVAHRTQKPWRYSDS